MKKLITFLVLFALALASITYLYYTHWRSEHQAEEAVPYVPQSAALVYEVSNFRQQWERFQSTPMAQSMNQLPAFEAIRQTIHLFENLLKDAKSLDEIPLTFSVHGLGGEQPEYIFYFNTRHKATQAFLKACMNNINADKSYSKVDRKYAGHKIITISKQGAAPHLSYIRYDPYIMASFSSLLVEDVVRSLAHKHPSSFLSLKKAPNSQGSLYINFRQLPQLLKVFINHDQAEGLCTALATFAHSSQLHVSLKQHHLLLSGFVQDQGFSRQYLTPTLASHTAAENTLLAPYIPQNTALLHYVNCSDVMQFIAARQLDHKQAEASTLEESTDLLAATLEPLLQGEIGHCTLAASQQVKAEQLVFMKVTDPSTFVEVLKKANLLVTLVAQQPGLPANFYKLKPDSFPSWLTRHLFPTFEANYLAQVDDCLVLANSQAAAQTWYAQFQQGETWANTATKRTWLASTLHQAQLGLLVDLQKAWPQIMQALRPTWKQVFERYVNALPSFSHASLQLFYEPHADPYMSILLKHKEACLSQPDLASQKTTIPEATPLKTLPSPSFFQTEAPIIHSPWLVKSHRSHGCYVLLQDALYQLYLLDPAGKLRWKKSLERPIITDVFEVDFYKNNKIQYGLGTDSQLHLIDYHGLRVGKYPYSLPQPLTHLQVVDYDHSKEYRLLIATAQGDVYLRDQQCGPLPAWNPKSLGCAFAGTPFHIRVQRKDYLLALQTNGTLQAFNRKGQACPGFPVDLNAPVHNPLLVHIGRTAADSRLAVLTDAGKYICLSLTGQIQKTVQLDRAEDSQHFVVCPSKPFSNRYAIVRRGTDKVTVMDEALNVLFELPSQAQELLMQYYDFGGKLQFYAFTNPEQQCTYLYDHAGKQLYNTPLQSGYEVSLIFSKEKQQLEVYSCAGKQCIKNTLDLDKSNR